MFYFPFKRCFNSGKVYHCKATIIVNLVSIEQKTFCYKNMKLNHLVYVFVCLDTYVASSKGKLLSS